MKNWDLTMNTLDFALFSQRLSGFWVCLEMGCTPSYGHVDRENDV